MFYDKLHKSRWECFLNNLSRTSHDHNETLAWLTSLQGPHAGAWLEAYPKSAAFTISNSDYQVMLGYRLRLKQSQIIPGSVCDCSGHPHLDPYGHHLITGCKKGGHRQRTHDAMKRELCSLFNFCGIWTKQEEVGIFRDISPTNNLRPDISVLADHVTGGKVIMDVSITCPIPGAAGHGTTGVIGPQNTLQRAGSVLSRNKALEKGRAAKIAAQAKYNKYAIHAKNSGLGFKALIFESAGHLHDDVINVLKQMAGYGERTRKIDACKLMRYMIISLSVCLQRSLASAFLQRVTQVNCRQMAWHHRHNHALIDEYDRIHVPCQLNSLGK